MKVIIVGKNRVEICEVRSRDLKKTFFNNRDCLYQILPSELVMLRTFKDGRECAEPEEVMLFEEGASVPFDVRDENAYWQEKVFPAIDLFRDVKRARLKHAGLLEALPRFGKALYPYIGIAVLGAVMLWAFLGGSS